MSTDSLQGLPRPSMLGGTMIISGTAVGAGMLSLPIVTSGLWFNGSVTLLVYIWACMLISGLMILEAMMHYPSGVNFYTSVKDLLGARAGMPSMASRLRLCFISSPMPISPLAARLSSIHYKRRHRQHQPDHC